jgi:hypothetical protein
VFVFYPYLKLLTRTITGEDTIIIAGASDITCLPGIPGSGGNCAVGYVRVCPLLRLNIDNLW